MDKKTSIKGTFFVSYIFHQYQKIMKHQPKNNQAEKEVQGKPTSDRAFIDVKEKKGHQVPNASSKSHANQEKK